MKRIEIKDVVGTDQVTVGQDSVKVSVKKDREVQWFSDDLKDWRVIFSPYAPVVPKVASPKQPTLTLKGGRPEDLRHCKYVVVGLTQDNQLKHEDPELVVDA